MLCPSLHSCAQFTTSLCKDTDHKEHLDSCSLILESDPSESPGSQRVSQMLPEPLNSHLNPPSENIKINKCGTCNRQLNKCECKVRCTACFNLECTCSKICNACQKYKTKYSNFQIVNDKLCNCAFESHMTIKNNLQSQIEDELPIDVQSDIEDDLEKRLSEYDLNLDDPNFIEPKGSIKISHIKEHEVRSGKL